MVIDKEVTEFLKENNLPYFEKKDEVFSFIDDDGMLIERTFFTNEDIYNFLLYFIVHTVNDNIGYKYDLLFESLDITSIHSLVKEVSLLMDCDLYENWFYDYTISEIDGFIYFFSRPNQTYDDVKQLKTFTEKDLDEFYIVVKDYLLSLLFDKTLVIVEDI